MHSQVQSAIGFYRGREVLWPSVFAAKSLPRSVFPLPCSAFTAWGASAVCVSVSVLCVLRSRLYSLLRSVSLASVLSIFAADLLLCFAFLLISSALCVCSPLEPLLLSAFCVRRFPSTLLRSAFVDSLILFCVRGFTVTLLRSVFADFQALFCVLRLLVH